MAIKLPQSSGQEPEYIKILHMSTSSLVVGQFVDIGRMDAQGRYYNGTDIGQSGHVSQYNVPDHVHAEVSNRLDPEPYLGHDSNGVYSKDVAEQQKINHGIQDPEVVAQSGLANKAAIGMLGTSMEAAADLGLLPRGQMEYFDHAQLCGTVYYKISFEKPTNFAARLTYLGEKDGEAAIGQNHAMADFNTSLLDDRGIPVHDLVWRHVIEQNAIQSSVVLQATDVPAGTYYIPVVENPSAGDANDVFRLRTFTEDAAPEHMSSSYPSHID